MTYTYTPHGVCSQKMLIELDNGVIRSVSILGGCHGNLQGIMALVKDRPAREVIDSLRGIDCRGKGTSCPDQLALALTEALAAEQSA